MIITTNKAMVDYWTVTTFDDALFDEWYSKMCNMEEMRREKIKRYEGWRGNGKYSKVFLGVGRQKGKRHFLIQCSGQDSDELLNEIFPLCLVDGRAKCTRIDLQVTIDEPENWSQIEYEELAEKHGLKPTKRRSSDKVNGGGLELMTVYTGTRESGRFNRVYEKVMMSGLRLLRFETQFGRGYAKAVAASLTAGKVSRKEVIKGEIYRRSFQPLEVFDLWKCAIYQPKQEKRVDEDKRAMWLISDILPVFAEYINRHDADPAVVSAFLATIHNSEVDNIHENGYY